MGNCMGNRQGKTSSSNVDPHKGKGPAPKPEPAPPAVEPKPVKQKPVEQPPPPQQLPPPKIEPVHAPKECLPSLENYREDVQKLLFGQLGFVKSWPKPRMIRMFISAVAVDSDLERSIFWNNIYPTLRSHCSEVGYEFLAIDPNEGTWDNLIHDKNTHDICSSVIRECQAKSTGPNFLLFLNQKHDRCICPLKIRSTAFDRLQKKVDEEQKALINRYYYDDTNAIPQVHILQPPHESCEDYANWPATKERICSIMRSCWGKEEKDIYMASDIEMEVSDGIFSPTSIKEGMVWVHRVLDDIDSTDNVAWKYLDLVGDSKEPDEHSQEQLSQLTRRLAEQVIESHFIKLRVPWKEGGLSPETHKDHEQYVEALKSTLLKQLLEIIDKSIAEKQRIDEEMQVKKISNRLFEEIQHHIFIAQRHCKNFVGQGDILEDLKNHLTSDSKQVLLLHGASGSGKSALAAKIAKVCQRDPMACVLRFVGASAASSNLNSVLQSVCEQLAHIYQEHVSIAYKGADKLGNVLSQLLKKVSPERPVLIILDGLERFDLDISWLPTTLPSHVKLLLTCTSSTQTYDKIKSHLGKQVTELDIPGLDEKTMKNLIERRLHSKGRTLNDEQFTFLSNKFEKQPLPLFLHMACYEASRWHSFTPSNELKLQASPKAQGEAMFESLEKRYGRTLVSCAMGHFCAARYGLSNVEMNDILSSNSTLLKDLKTERLPTLLWETILFELEPFIQTNINNSICLRQFCYPVILETAKKRYLDTNEKQLALHSSLRNHFLKQHDTCGKMPNIRRMQELPYHAFKCGDKKFSDVYIWDLEWLSTKLSHCGVYEVLEDILLGLQSYPNDLDLKLLQDVLQVSAYALVCDGLQLIPQIQQRLGDMLKGQQNKYPRMISLCNMANRPPFSNFLPSNICLLPLNSSERLETSQGCDLTAIFRIKGDDKHMVSVSSAKGEVSVWNVATQKAVRTLTNVDKPLNIHCIDRYKVIILCNRVLKIYNLDTGELETKLKGTMNIQMPYFALHDEEHVVALSRNRMTVNIIKRSTGDVVSTFKVGEDRFLNSLLVSENGEKCVCGDETQKPSPLLVWDLNNRKLVHDLRIPQHEFITKMSSISNDGHYVVCVIKELGDSSPNFVIVYDLQSGQLFKKWKPHCNTTAVFVSVEGGCVVNALEDSSLIVWDLSSGGSRHTLRGHTNPIDSIYLSQDGTRCLTFDSSQKDRTIRAWDLHSGQRLASFTPDEPISCCQISADGSCAVIGLPSQNTIVTLWIRNKDSADIPTETSSYGDSALNGKVYKLGE
ncbi:NACHT and WD repeat domain-containing protein 2-like isoform X2 [Anneissia japonica]|uniref:NACHT and WD repeat domain-containing protein 2-like isoform X2 n=1 Tax=Anneissia japonica TaxID=1529436 RepID=UPI0014258DA7|nr:NACHT and WD repeat domain-containing protein 2-like isoform X2 [Anneissia japonica]